MLVTLDAVLVTDEDPAAETKPSEMLTGEASLAGVKPATSALTAGKGVLKNIKTMFYVGTEVSLYFNFMISCRQHISAK